MLKTDELGEAVKYTYCAASGKEKPRYSMHVVNNFIDGYF
jgi:hypothetical protein